MLIGNADVQILAKSAPNVSAFSDTPLSFGEVTCFQLTAEMPNSAREAALPPALHPTIPAALSVPAYEVGESPWGAFKFVTVRVSCRSGVRARGFTTATVVNHAPASTGLSSSLGFPCQVGEIYFRHGYDGVSLEVILDQQSVLNINAIDPEPMGPDDVQYTGTLNLAHTTMGLRLLQIEAQTTSRQVDRLQARLLNFDGAAWGNPLLKPTRVIAASVAKLSLTFPPVRFVCKPDELAFTGTEAVNAD